MKVKYVAKIQKRKKWEENKKSEKNKIKRLTERGITLMALVITIIILIILATIAIRGAVGDNGLVGWAKEARDKTKQGEEDEDKAMSDLDKYIEDQTADSGVIINISKTPETEKTGAVLLKVESVEGIEGNIDFNNVDISTLTEEEKKNMVKVMAVFINNIYNEAKVKSFNEFVSLHFSTEEEFWNECLSYYDGNIDNFLQEGITFFKDDGIQTINNYTVVNPDGDISDYQLVTENGTYTFKVVEITTGKEYTKSVQVSNIDTSMQDYYVNLNDGCAYLLDKTTDEPTTFESAYITYNNEKINITSCIKEENSYNFIRTMDLKSYFNLPYDENLILEIVKNGKKYFDILVLHNPV